MSGRWIALLLVCMLVLVQGISALAVGASEGGSMESSGEEKKEDTKESSSEESSSEECSSKESSSSEESSSKGTLGDTSGKETEKSDPEASGEDGIDPSLSGIQLLDLEPEDPEEEDPVPYVEYRTHVQAYGWQQGFVKDGASSGTEGQAKRLEAIEIRIGNNDIEKLNGGIRYQTHVQSYGWQGWAADGAQSGTTGLAKRLEGIRIELTGNLANEYDVYYRVHVQSFGWMDWAKNGELAGTTGLAKRLESIQIRLVKKGDAAPGSTARPNAMLPSVTYKCHAQTYGWLDWVPEGETSGVLNQGKRLESIAVKLTGDTHMSGGIEYRTHVQTYGWQNWSGNGSFNGTEGLAKRVEAIQIRLTGEIANVCDVYYRAYVEGFGWLGWVKNGEVAGTSGLALRIEAMEIRIGAKSGLAPVVTGSGSHEYTGPGYYQIGNRTYYYYSNGMRSAGNGWTIIGGKRYYIENGVYATGWKYIDGLKYYFNSDGSLCQNVDGIIGPQSSYVLKLNKQMNCLTIYAADGANGYIIPVKAMLTSTGDDTPLGTFYTPIKYRWRKMVTGAYAQYATRLTAGKGFLFHSITYEQMNSYSLQTIGYNMLGINKSLGCIRLVCGDAYWIYTRCPLGTKVIVYNDGSSPGPFDRPVVTPIPADQRWDPTDPNL